MDDLARLCVAEGARSQDAGDTVLDAVGPERPTFEAMVRSVADAVGSHSRIVHVPPRALPPLSAALGVALRDRLLTADEFGAMSSGLADTDGPATGTTALTDWLHTAAPTLGRHYANELHRHYR